MPAGLLAHLHGTAPKGAEGLPQALALERFVRLRADRGAGDRVPQCRLAPPAARRRPGHAAAPRLRAASSDWRENRSAPYHHGRRRETRRDARHGANSGVEGDAHR